MVFKKKRAYGRESLLVSIPSIISCIAPFMDPINSEYSKAGESLFRLLWEGLDFFFTVKILYCGFSKKRLEFTYLGVPT